MTSQAAAALQLRVAALLTDGACITGDRLLILVHPTLS